MKIETSRLELIPCTPSTASIAVSQNYDNGPQISNHLIELAKDPTLIGWGTWLVVRKSDSIIIGDAGFKGKPNIKKEIEIGYGLLEKYWDMGYATESVEGLIHWALQKAEVEKVVAETELDNHASIRVLQKAKMKKTKKTASMIYWELSKI